MVLMIMIDLVDPLTKEFYKKEGIYELNLECSNNS